jgi:hypothetical protein
MIISTEERDQGQLSEANLEIAVRDLKVKGYVIIDDILTHEAKHLNELFLELLEERTKDQPPNRGVARYNVHIPTEGAFVDPALIGNPLALQVISSMLDGDITCSFYASDTPLPGSDYQAAHWDGQDLFPGLPVALPPYALVLDVPLVDFTSENGPLEIWPYGTHLMTSVALRRAAQSAEDERSTPIQQFAAEWNPQPVFMSAGSLLIRDCRMWHRGSPNRSAAPRPMLAFMYHRPWFRFGEVSFRKEVFESLPEPVQHVFRFARVEDRPAPVF